MIGNTKPVGLALPVMRIKNLRKTVVSKGPASYFASSFSASIPGIKKYAPPFVVTKSGRL
ncbi:hypothetical protein M2273_004849 [Mucilaginibacter lappiensis]